MAAARRRHRDTTAETCARIGGLRIDAVIVARQHREAPANSHVTASNRSRPPSAAGGYSRDVAEIAPAVRELAHAELARLCESDALRRSPTHLRLLRYLVERAIDRDRAALTETAIAIAVFRRDPGVYDPQVDPIVRVSVGRLRARLASVYASATSARAMRIVVPRGRYVPEFEPGPAATRPRGQIAVLHMRNATGSELHASFCRRFGAALVAALARSGTRIVVARGSGSVPATASAGCAGGHGPPSAEAILDPMLTTDANGDLRITVRLLDTVDAHVRWVETAADAPHARARLGERAVARVVSRVAASAPTTKES
ncbi:MAG TPA: hypothetical protein VFX05_14080 [Casimicrobiaceae bacterium]|nr:hypothetical protein [Casimicrobiaceae bacterium]